MVDFIHNLILAFTWRNKMCNNCLYLKATSNHSPCCKCVYGSNYEKDNYER